MKQGLAASNSSEGPALKVGSFYWVMPVHDVDFDAPFEHWMRQEQPARYAGKDETGQELWQYLGLEGDLADGAQAWPTRWIGAEIVWPPHVPRSDLAQRSSGDQSRRCSKFANWKAPWRADR